MATFTPYNPTNDDPIVDNQPQQQVTQQTPLQAGVSMWKNTSNAFKNGVEIPEGSIPDKIFKTWDNNPIGNYLNQHADELPLLAPSTVLSLPVSQALAPFENFIAQRTTMPLMNAINPYLQKAGNAIKGITPTIDNAFQNAGNYLLDRFGGNTVKNVSSDDPIGLGRFNFDPSPAPTRVTADPQAYNEITPYTGYQGNTSINPYTTSTQGETIGNPYINYQAVRPQKPISGLLPDNLSQYSYKYPNANPNTGFIFNQNLPAVYKPFNSIPINADEMVNQLTNHYAISPETTTFKPNDMTNTEKQYMYEQLFGDKSPARQLNLFGD